MRVSKQELQEVILDASVDLNEAMKKLDQIRSQFEPDELRGVELALKGIALKPPALTVTAKGTLRATLQNLLDGAASDGFDRGYARVLLEYLELNRAQNPNELESKEESDSASGQEEGQVKTVGYKPDEDEGSDPVGING